MQGFAPTDESLLFRQKEPKPFSPGRGPSESAQKQSLRGTSASAPNKMARELAESILSPSANSVQALSKDSNSPRRKVDSGLHLRRTQRGEGLRKQQNEGTSIFETRNKRLDPISGLLNNKTHSTRHGRGGSI